jgi:hypothetical protein
MYCGCAKLRIISIVLLFSWLSAAYVGGVFVCVEIQGDVQFEVGWMTECCAPKVCGAVDCPNPTCDKCKHYPLQLCPVHRSRNFEIACAENLFHIPQFHSDIDGYANIAYQSFLPIPTDNLCTVVLII